VKRSRSFLRYRRGSRDANHVAIRDGLRNLGHEVIDLAPVGDGVADLEVFRFLGAGIWSLKPTFLELKVGKGKLRESQLAWRERAASRGIRVRTVTTLAEALEALL
jgi:hypothetical protein